MVFDNVGVPTIENCFGLLRQVLGAALEDKRIPRNPCDGVKLPKRQYADRGYLSHAQVVALAGAVERQPEVVKFLAYTGLRCAGSTCRGRSLSPAAWCGLRPRHGSADRFRSRRRWPTSWPR